MNTKKLSSFVISLVILLSGCSSLGISADLPVVKPDKGLIIFYRVKNRKGAAMRFEITDSAKGSIGFLSNGTNIHKYLEPGNHTFTVRTPSVSGQDSITINAEAGQIYYVKGEIIWGWPTGRPKFSQMSDSEAQSDLAKMR